MTPLDDDAQHRAVTRVLSEEPRYGLYSISAIDANGRRTVCAYCRDCNRQDAVFIISRTGRVTRKPGDGSKWVPV